MGNSFSSAEKQQKQQKQQKHVQPDNEAKKTSDSLPPVLRVNLGGSYYTLKNPVQKSYTVARGHKTEICHPHARVVQRLPLHELRDDKTTYVFRLSGAGNVEGSQKRASLQNVRLEVDDLSQIVGFRCMALHPEIKTDGGYELASGDVSDLMMWNEVNRQGRRGELLELPCRDGFFGPLRPSVDL